MRPPIEGPSVAPGRLGPDELRVLNELPLGEDDVLVQGRDRPPGVSQEFGRNSRAYNDGMSHDGSEDRRDSIPADTSPEAAQVQLDLWRRMSTIEKAAVVSGVSTAVLRLSLAGIRSRHPDASDRECMLRLAVITLGRELTCKVYPEAAGLADPENDR